VAARALAHTVADRETPTSDQDVNFPLLNLLKRRFQPPGNFPMRVNTQ